MIKAYIDGSIGPSNPGKIASYGFEVRENGTTIHTQGGLIAKSDDSIYTNNVAEYGALIAFFLWYKKYSSEKEIVVHSDSQLLVNQINGKWQAGNGVYLPYYKKAKKEFFDIKRYIEIIWIPREMNELADEISKYYHYSDCQNCSCLLD